MPSIWMMDNLRLPVFENMLVFSLYLLGHFTPFINVYMLWLYVGQQLFPSRWPSILEVYPFIACTYERQKKRNTGKDHTLNLNCLCDHTGSQANSHFGRKKKDVLEEHIFSYCESENFLQGVVEINFSVRKKSNPKHISRFRENSVLKDLSCNGQCFMFLEIIYVHFSLNANLHHERHSNLSNAMTRIWH